MKGRRIMKKAKIVKIIFMAAVVTAMVSFSGCGKEQENADSNNVTEVNNAENVAGGSENSNSQEDEKVYKPTFMYFVSESDSDYEKTNEVVEKLKKEYAGKVEFDIRNVDKNPDVLNNFEIVKGQTPALIMLNTKNDISNFLFQNGNYDDLKATIEAALK